MALVHALIRIWAFVGKEIAEVLRQPLLVLTLIVAPFLILLLFGLGFQGDTQAFRAEVVMAADSPLRDRIPELAKPLKPIMRIEGITDDEQYARALLRDGKVDLVIIAPSDALASVQANRKAPVTFLHNEIDPFRLDSVNYAGQAFVTSANQLAAQGVVGQAQERVAQTNRDVARSAGRHRPAQAGPGHPGPIPGHRGPLGPPAEPPGPGQDRRWSRGTGRLGEQPGGTAAVGR